MSLSRSGYYQPSTSAAARQAADRRLLGEIERIADEFPAYGYRRITRELRRRGTVVNHKRVARVMLAVLLDAWSRKVAGYALSPHLDARLPLAALDAALADWAPPPGLIQHSDRGVQPEFNRSSQHFDGRCGVADEEATVGSSRTWEDGFSGAPWHGPA
jgi:transposase InsO family protein